MSVTTRQFELFLPRQLAGEMAPGVTRGDWRSHRAVPVQHPQGGYTVALPLMPGSTAREYRGRYETIGQARAAAHVHNSESEKQTTK